MSIPRPDICINLINWNYESGHPYMIIHVVQGTIVITVAVLYSVRPTHTLYLVMGDTQIN